jgi:secreted Zn-dependent insulinase-like peptidase
VNSLAYGNVDESDALAWADEVADSLAAQAPRNGSTLPNSPVVKLSAGTTHLLQTRGVQEEDVNNVIFSFYQAGGACR